MLILTKQIRQNSATSTFCSFHLPSFWLDKLFYAGKSTFRIQYLWLCTIEDTWEIRQSEGNQLVLKVISQSLFCACKFTNIIIYSYDAALGIKMLHFITVLCCPIPVTQIIL